jgi:butyrate kinase
LNDSKLAESVALWFESTHRHGSTPTTDVRSGESSQHDLIEALFDADHTKQEVFVLIIDGHYLLELQE